MLQHSMNEYQNYISTLQKRLVEAKTGREEIEKQKLDYEVKYNELKAQYEIVLERGLNAKVIVRFFLYSN